MSGAELHTLLTRVAEPDTPEDRDAAWNAIADEFTKRSTWIDPQRIVDLGKRRTEEGKAGWVEIRFSDHAPEYVGCWQLTLPHHQVVDCATPNEALKIAEEA